MSKKGGDVKCTNDKKFLEDAFAGESMAHMKYMIFAEDAEQKGLTKLAICGSYRLCRVCACEESF